MATLCTTFPTPESARHAVAALSSAGVPADEIGLLIGPPGETIDDDGAWRFLTGAQVPDGVARRMVRHLHEGEAVLCLQLSHVDLRTAEALISDPTAAA
jgi:hypothetical protein